MSSQSSLSSSTLAESLTSTQQGSLDIMSDKTRAELFGCDLRLVTLGRPDTPTFDHALREAMEPFLRPARLLRELCRSCNQHHSDVHVHDSIASSVGVPYTALRKERRFLFDEYTHPLHAILTETLGLPTDLAHLHELESVTSDEALLEPLLHRHKRHHFQDCYDSFVTSFCIPLLHSLAMSKNLFQTISNEGTGRITYRYQAFPSIRVLRPGDCLNGPQCDAASGHSIGNLCFHVPLTPTFGTNALYAESHPGREDWHPFTAKAIGLGYLFDGARCLHFSLENTTDATSVFLEFRIAMYNNDAYVPHCLLDGSGLCTRYLLEDKFSRLGPGYYDEAVIDFGAASPAYQIAAVAAKRRGSPSLLDPDYRVGVPFH